MKFSTGVLTLLVATATQSFVDAKTIVHDGILYTATDIARAKAGIANEVYPYFDTYEALTTSRYATADYSPNPQVGVTRGKTSWAPTENYVPLFRDAAAAYQLALRWTVTGNATYGAAAARVLNAWASTLTFIQGSSDKWLAAGIYGYELAVAAELLRGYEGFTAENQTAVSDLLLNVFYPLNSDFLTNHNTYGPNDTHYWANWDLCNLASSFAISVFTDRGDIYDTAFDYLKNGGGRGSFPNLFPHVFTPAESDNTFGLAQNQESARDQGHAGLDLALLGVIAQITTLQGDDIWSYNDSIALKGAEYFAQYNLGYDVPFNSYYAQGTLYEGISPASRGVYRPIWSLFYSIYVKQRGFTAKYLTELYEANQVETGGGFYGTSSGGFDQLGFGTIAYLTNDTVTQYL